MADSNKQDDVVIVILSEEKIDYVVTCKRNADLAHVRSKWQEKCNLIPSVAFISQEGRLLSDQVTIAEILPRPEDRSLDLRTIQKLKCRLQLFGLKSTRTELEIVPIQKPTEVRENIKSALRIHKDDFRLTLDGTELDLDRPFDEQGIREGSQIMVESRVTVNFRYDDERTKTVECFVSERVSALHEKMECGTDTVLIVTSPTSQRVLNDHLHVCDIVKDLQSLETSIDVTVKKKSELIYMTFELVSPTPVRMQLPIIRINTPIDIYDLVSEHFQITTDFSLYVRGQELDYREPLLNQVPDANDVIQVVLLLTCLVCDLWANPVKKKSVDEKVDLYFSENLRALCQRGFEQTNQRVYQDGQNLPIKGLTMDVLGSSSNCPVLRIDRDIKKNLPVLTPDGLDRMPGWAKDELLSVASKSRGRVPKELMVNGKLLPAKKNLHKLPLTDSTMTITDPEKVFISSGKKLQIHRFAHSSTYSDIQKQLEQQKSSHDIGLKAHGQQVPEEELDRKLDKENLHLTCVKRCKTEVTVTLEGETLVCSFEQDEVSFSDVITDVIKQQIKKQREITDDEKKRRGSETKRVIPPRHFHSKILYCSGCGRSVSKQEELYQEIPARCCRVKSLTLTDRRIKDVGTQTVTPKVHEKSIWINPDLRDTTTDPLDSFMPLCIQAQSLENNITKVVTVENSADYGALISAVDREVDDLPAPLMFTQEVLYNRDNEKRKAIRCFDEDGAHYPFIDVEDGGVATKKSWDEVFYNFHQPSSALPPVLRLPPFICIEPNVDFFQVSSKRRLKVAPRNALSDKEFVVAMRGIRVDRCKKNTDNVFWEVFDNNSREKVVYFVNSKTGKIFKAEKIPGHSKRFVFAFLRNGDLVPRAKVPKGLVFYTFVRANFKPYMQNDRVRCDVRQTQDIEKWNVCPKECPFAKELTLSVRK